MKADRETGMRAFVVVIAACANLMEIEPRAVSGLMNVPTDDVVAFEVIMRGTSATYELGVRRSNVIGWAVIDSDTPDDVAIGMLDEAVRVLIGYTTGQSEVIARATWLRWRTDDLRLALENIRDPSEWKLNRV